jgi:hypothetical protein
MRDDMPVTVEVTGEKSPLEITPFIVRVRIWRNDGPVEDLAAGEIGIQVDVGGQDEVLVVVVGCLA